MSALVAVRPSARAARLLVVSGLLAGSMLAPPVTIAVGETINVDFSTTNPFGTEVGGTIQGDPDSTYHVRISAADTCSGASAPEAELPISHEPVLTQADGSGFFSAFVEPPIQPGWSLIVTLWTEDGSTLLATSACSVVDGSLVPSPNAAGAYIMEPERTTVVLDYGLDDEPSCELTLDATSVPDPADFIVTLNGAQVAVANIAIPTDDPCPVILAITLAEPLATGNISLEYTPGANPIRNQAGGESGAFDFPSGIRDRANVTLTPGSSTTTDGEGDGAVTLDPIETTATAAITGADVTLDIVEETQFGLTGRQGFRTISAAARIRADGATASDPLEMTFEIDASRHVGPFGESIPIGELEVMANGTVVPPCDAGAGAAAVPDPCEVSRSDTAGWAVTVRSGGGERFWTFGYDLAPTMLAFETPHLASLDHVILIFFEEIDPASLPAPDDFTVLVDGAAQEPNRVSILASGLRNFSNSAFGFQDGFSFLELGWEDPVPGYGTVTVGYTPGADPLRDLQGQPVTGGTQEAIIAAEAFPIATTDAVLGNDHVLLLLPGRLTALPAPGDFSVTTDSGVYTAIDVVQRFPHLGVTLLDITLPVDVDSFASLSHVGSTPLTFVDGTEVPVADLSVDTAGLGPAPGETAESTDPVTVTPPDSSTLATTASITFPQVTAGGVTTVASSIETTAPEPIPANFSVGDPPAYYEITTTAEFVPPAEVCIAYNPGAYADESAVRLLHFEADAWVDVTTSLDTASNTVCGAVDSFSPFAVVEAAAVGPSFHFFGFLSPVNNLPTVNTVSAGRAIPVKFSLGGDFGLGIFGAGSPASVRVACPTDPPLDAIETSVPTTANTLSYDPVADQYTYVWKTAKSWAGTCRLLTLELADGTVKEALFRFGR